MRNIIADNIGLVVGVVFVGAIVIAIAVLKHSVTVPEEDWQTLAKVAQSKCTGKSSCVFNLSDAYPSDWTDAYVFGLESIGYVEYWSGTKLYDPWPIDNFYDNACQSLVLVGKDRRVVLFLQTACGHSVGPDFYSVSGKPSGGFSTRGEVIQGEKQDFVHFKRGADALCARRYDPTVTDFTFEKYDKNTGCKPESFY